MPQSQGSNRGSNPSPSDSSVTSSIILYAARNCTQLSLLIVTQWNGNHGDHCVRLSLSLTRSENSYLSESLSYFYGVCSNCLYMTSIQKPHDKNTPKKKVSRIWGLERGVGDKSESFGYPWRERGLWVRHTGLESLLCHSLVR